MCVIVCAGPPFCHLRGDMAEAQQSRGCTVCRRFPCNLAPGEDLPRLSRMAREDVRALGLDLMGDDFDEQEFQTAADLIDEARPFGGIQ